MKLYRIQFETRVQKAAVETKLWAGTQAEARELKATLVEKYCLKKNDVSWQEVNIPTAKPDFLAWLNSKKII